MQYIRYAWQLLQHKWHVFNLCRKEGIWWLGIVHDLSKLRPSEFISHARYFGVPESKRTDKRKFAMDRAWALHLKRNKHHWQYWVTLDDSGSAYIYPMPLNYVLEMLCDWKARAIYRDNTTLLEWYEDKAPLMHPSARSYVLFRINKDKWSEELLQLWKNTQASSSLIN